MKRFLFLTFLLTALSASAISNVAPVGETLNYKVMYKWGLVNKQAGHATLRTLGGSEGHIRPVLTAATEKWADRFYKVRDTLRGNIITATCEPTFYEKISHEGGDHKHDKITYQRTGNSVTGTCDRFKQKKNKPAETSQKTLHSDGLTLDMLSAFYYMRAIDYPMMSPKSELKLTVFSGKRKETLTIRYRGIAKIEIDGKTYETYHILFRFTSDSGKQTSDDMDAWISTAPDRIPLKLEGKLPVGKVQCFFTGKG